MKTRKETDKPIAVEHSPLPWIHNTDEEHIDDANGKMIATAYDDRSTYGIERQEANNAFIAKAVNSYERNDAFLDKLEDDLIELQCRIEKSKVTDGEFAHGILTGRASLAKEIVDKLQAHFEAIRKAEGITDATTEGR